MKDFQLTLRDGRKIVISFNLRAINERRRVQKFIRTLAGKSTTEIFSDIYAKQIWGGSGPGSRNSFVVEPYINSISQFAAALPERLDAVDLGCGDFAIGSRLRPLFNRYIAGDIVPDVISRNRARFGNLDVDFRVVDITADDLPPGDIAFVRQVLQHLSNDEIARAVNRLRATYPRLVLTEHLPLAADFVPNIDIPTGPNNRLGVNSGVDITKPPFEIPVLSATVLCEVVIEENIDGPGSPASRIRTTLYEF
ncbi:class I SAM-dependent methyltransferase [Mycobacterium seoulense]|uniref:class I SAM-dependent methyltransferase n=1 Tax=Mycobacterium seoulense TaxID=386911 RepID=UPI0013D8B84D|nr:methyltransferase domain-containing protein [Mycobacterium seoulense]MCV7440542.1 class I SAM-dependent methyltransferase [Mycobacterium seoulense]